MPHPPTQHLTFEEGLAEALAHVPHEHHLAVSRALTAAGEESRDVLQMTILTLWDKDDPEKWERDPAEWWRSFTKAAREWVCALVDHACGRTRRVRVARRGDGCVTVSSHHVRRPRPSTLARQRERSGAAPTRSRGSRRGTSTSTTDPPDDDESSLHGVVPAEVVG